MNLARCASLTYRPETGIWFRAIQPHFMPAHLSTAYTTGVSSRFSDPASASPTYQILYLAENPNVALFEVQALLGSPATPGGVIPHPRRAYTVLNIRVSLSAVVDLTDVGEQSRIDTNAQELTGDWKGYQLRGLIGVSITAPTGPAPTQELGSALHNLPDLEGFCTLSARVPYEKVLVLFPAKLHLGSSVELFNTGLGIYEPYPF